MIKSFCLLSILSLLATMPVWADSNTEFSDNASKSEVTLPSTKSPIEGKAELYGNVETDETNSVELPVDQPLTQEQKENIVEQLRNNLAVKLDAADDKGDSNGLFSSLAKLAEGRHNKLHGSATNALSCLGFEILCTSMVGPAQVIFVDQKSDVFNRITPGDEVLSIDSEPVLQYNLNGHNFGNANTIAQIVVCHQDGTTEELQCSRHPIEYFSAAVQRRLLPF